VNIYIDESGTFVNADAAGSWNVIAAYASPESSRRDIAECVGALRRKHPNKIGEVKLKDISEDEYFVFLTELTRLGGVVFCVATDAGRNDSIAVAAHQIGQVKGVLKHLDKMIHESGKEALRQLSQKIANLPPQLYIQLVCLLELMHNVISGSILYFVQRHPQTLNEFRWRLDQKDIEKTAYEKAFELLCAPSLQSKSFNDPILMVTGFDYSHMARYEFAKEEFPTHLREIYGIPVKDGFNVVKMARGNFKLVDSKKLDGIQVADLIASGMRRCLRRGFLNNDTAAELLGSLLVEKLRGRPSVGLISLHNESLLDADTAHVVNIMTRASRPMLAVKRPRL